MKHDHAVHADLDLNLRLVEVDRALCKGCRKASHRTSLCEIDMRSHTGGLPADALLGCQDGRITAPEKRRHTWQADQSQLLKHLVEV